MLQAPLLKCALVALFLRTLSRGGPGLPQSSPLSPLMLNPALLLGRPPDQPRKLRLPRCANDFLLFSRTREAAEAGPGRMAMLRRPLGREKPRIAHLDESIGFLEYRFDQDVPAR
jgi:hypothetical protein